FSIVMIFSRSKCHSLHRLLLVRAVPNSEGRGGRRLLCGSSACKPKVASLSWCTQNRSCANFASADFAEPFTPRPTMTQCSFIVVMLANLLDVPRSQRRPESLRCEWRQGMAQRGSRFAIAAASLRQKLTHSWQCFMAIGHLTARSVSATRPDAVSIERFWYDCRGQQFPP